MTPSDSLMSQLLKELTDDPVFPRYRCPPKKLEGEKPHTFKVPEKKCLEYIISMQLISSYKKSGIV